MFRRLTSAALALLLAAGLLYGGTTIIPPPGPPSADWATDARRFEAREEFLTATIATAGSVANLGWTLRTIGGAPTGSYRSGVAPNLGLYRITTTATSTQGGSLAMDTSTIGPLGNLAAIAFDSRWVVSVATTTSVRVRVGYAETTGSGVTEPAGGIWLRYDTSVGYADTHWICEARASSTSTTTTSGTAIGTGYFTLRLRSLTAGTILCSVNGGTEIALTTNVPTTSMTPVAIVATDTTAARTLDLDLWAFEAHGLAR